MVSTTSSFSSTVDGVWSEWGDWGECSVSCDDGNQSRHRTCVGPFYAGNECKGNDSDTRTCFTEPCQSKRPVRTTLQLPFCRPKTVAGIANLAILQLLIHI